MEYVWGLNLFFVSDYDDYAHLCVPQTSVKCLSIPVVVLSEPYATPNWVGTIEKSESIDYIITLSRLDLAN